MTASRAVLTTKDVVGSTPALVVGQVLAMVKDVATTLATEAKERERISADLTRDLERIRATESIVLGYLDASFEERRASFARFFTALDSAIAAHDAELAGTVLERIVETLSRSPLQDLKDLAAVRAKLDDPGAEWQL